MVPINEVSDYIAEKCANYDQNGLCLLETISSGGRICPLFQDIGKKCSYAENAVLPGDDRIEAIYYAGRAGKANKDYCERCQEQFKRTSPRQIRCKSCAESVRRNARRSYNAAARKSVGCDKYTLNAHYD